MLTAGDMQSFAGFTSQDFVTVGVRAKLHNFARAKLHFCAEAQKELARAEGEGLGGFAVWAG